MIGLLSGTIRYKKAPYLVIECGGVGYEVEATMNAFAQLPEIGGQAVLYTHLSVREDAHVLFGFSDWQERDLFRVLIKVSGIGPKMGIAILSGMSVPELASAITAQDSVSLTKLPGIGKKTAERMVVELKDKLTAMATLPSADGAAPSVSQVAEDAVAGLVALGIKPQMAEKMIAAVYQEGSDSATLIRYALQQNQHKR
ncbi:MAG: Holliday junction branch migration protein RuvA [Gammaproteobacteria bacterium]|nr:MAG: Holliday junction branch migration protein RuvA [Gammaproteobacteria bacterium]